MTAAPRLRCAVYTRKSTEEGLDQAFNTLDAQREACEAFIASQAGLGWALVPTLYDDGGISGGTMERPALLQMLDDIKARLIDVVVVYKIDRLTRSLMDFAKIVDILDSSKASFVSVTQAFNTTTSMGRLTLNVLLSFAQFEREVTAERIRDKIAASKKKGMWMGGTVPLGYRSEGRSLAIDDAEAQTVRYLFTRYCELKSVRILAEEALTLNLTARRKVRRDGRMHLTRPFGRGNLYHLLSNPIYIGKIRHKALIHDGNHQPIVDDALFEKVQTLLASQSPTRAQTTNIENTHLLTGILFDETGDRLSPSHASKQGKRYRYYVSNRLVTKRKKASDEGSGWRVPAAEIERMVEREFDQILGNAPRLLDWIRPWLSTDIIEAALHEAKAKRAAWGEHTPIQKHQIIQNLFASVTLTPNRIRFQMSGENLARWLTGALPSISAQKQPLAIKP